MEDPAEPLLAWGFDPIFFGEQRMTTRELDRVSATRPIAVLHASIHLLNVNTAMLRKAGIGRHTEVEGVARDPDGSPSGELQEFAAMFPVMRAIGNAFKAAGTSEEGLWRFGRVAQLAGVTTATDMLNDWSEEAVARHGARHRPRGLPGARRLRVPQPRRPTETERGLRRLGELQRLNAEKLRFSLVKLVVDGSIQGFTARLRWPGYYNGSPNGIWIVPPNELAGIVETAPCGRRPYPHPHQRRRSDRSRARRHRGGARPASAPRPSPHLAALPDGGCRAVPPHGAAGRLREPLRKPPVLLGRRTLHADDGPGPRESHGCLRHRAALRRAVRDPLGCADHSARAAFHRVVRGQPASPHPGASSGAAERIDVAQALSAITLGAAYTLKMDHEIGSIEVGKRADFCVLEDDPLALPPERLKDVRVWGTVMGGRAFEAPHA